MGDNGKKPLVSVIVPVYYNAESLRDLYARFLELEKAVPYCDLEYVFVDDGSKDDSFRLLTEIQATDPRVCVLKLARNFGSHEAVLAGMSVASGDAAAFIAADLQDDPLLLKGMIDDWRGGVPVVLAVREGREDSLLDRALARLYYALVRKTAIYDMPEGGFDFALLDRQVVNLLNGIKEKNTTLTGLILWMGFPRSVHPYTRRAREKGRSRWTVGKKVKLLLDSVLSFGYLPVRLMSLAGMVLSFIAFAYAGLIIINKVLTGIPVEGWASIMVVVLILSGVQMLSLGILGEYIWRTLDASRRRPTFIIHKDIPSLYRGSGGQSV